MKLYNNKSYQNILIKVLNFLVWLMLGAIAVVVTLIFGIFVLFLIYSPEQLSNWFVIKPWGKVRIEYCTNILSVHMNEDIETIFFQHRKVLENLKEIGGVDTGFELNLVGWDRYWGCLTGKSKLTVLNYREDKIPELKTYIKSLNVPFRIELMHYYEYREALMEK